LQVVVEKGSTHFVVDADDDVEPVENLTQEQALKAVVGREVHRALEVSALNDEFDEEEFVEDDGSRGGHWDIDDISQGLEDDEVGVASEDEDDFTSGQTSLDDVVLEDEYRLEPSSEDENDTCEARFTESLRVPVDGH
jgi:hypothetical protein